MNRKSLLSLATVAVALIGSGAAFAQEATSDAWMQAAATKSRAQVYAELQQARKDGTIRAWSAGYNNPVLTSAPRAAVQAEALAARRNGNGYDVEAHAFAPVQGRTASTVLAGK